MNVIRYTDLLLCFILSHLWMFKYNTIYDKCELDLLLNIWLKEIAFCASDFWSDYSV